MVILRIQTRRFEEAIQRKMAKFPEKVDRAAKSIIDDATADLNNALSKLNPPLKTEVEHSGRGNYLLISTDIRWFSLNYGVKRHEISAKAGNTKGMIFPWANSRQRGEHVARTQRAFVPGPGEGNDTYKSGASMTYGWRKVDHPGVRARNYKGLLRRKYRPLLKPRVIAALRNA